ncbi:MAG: toxin-antitoxin system HicB family antitoxin [Peptoanaerobacter stomatis]|uniref:toxin-antitoxin system HicB family antitoxin n=1 Tax=Peptoanaerobacter stomatis TaxID=796937 RepID=UPI003FA0A35B
MDKTLTLRVDPKLHHDIKIHIAKQNIALKDYIINLIKCDLYKASLQNKLN